MSHVEPRLQLIKDTNEKDINPTLYRKLIGSLRYLSNTRHDLTYNVSIVSRFMERQKSSHLVAAKSVLRYIRGAKYMQFYFNLGTKVHKIEEVQRITEVHRIMVQRIIDPYIHLGPKGRNSN